MRSIRATYADAETANAAVRGLNEAHVDSEDIGVLEVSDEGRRKLVIETKVGDVKGALQGTLIGLVCGVLFAALVSLGIAGDGGVGFVSDSELVTWLRSLSMGPAIGALTGYLTGLAFWRVEIGVRAKGAFELVLHVRSSERRLPEMKAIFERTGATQVDVEAES